MTKNSQAEELRAKIHAFVPILSERHDNAPPNIRKPIVEANNALDELVRSVEELTELRYAISWLANYAQVDNEAIDFEKIQSYACEGFTDDVDRIHRRNEGESHAEFVLRAYRNRNVSPSPVSSEGRQNDTERYAQELRG